MQAEIYLLGKTESDKVGNVPQGWQSCLPLDLSGLLSLEQYVRPGARKLGRPMATPSCVELHPPKNGLKGSVSQHFLLWLFTHPQTPSTANLFSSVQFTRSVVSGSLRPHEPRAQASLSITNSLSAPKLMSIDLVMLYNHLILCRPLLLLLSIFPSIRVFSNESAVCIRWPKYWSFSFSISPSNEHPGLICFRMTGWISLHSKGPSGVFSNTTEFKSINSLGLNLLYSPTVTSMYD